MILGSSSRRIPHKISSKAHLEVCFPGLSIPSFSVMVDLRKSPSDPRNYLYSRLPNGLQCLVISDPETDISAGALCVASGSLKDPAEVPGLAHFLEHMLFLGTEKYPSESTYHAFLKEHAGMSNAYTGHEETNYFFSVAKEELEQALDIFAQFFISPLFNESCVAREMRAVDSEHAKNLKSDNWRVHQLLCSLANPTHPFNHFATGSLSTLQQPGIRQKLIQLYRENYSAERMAMVLVGKEETATLMKWCTERLSLVPNYPQKQPILSLNLPYLPHQMATLTKVVSVMDRKEIEIYWQLPGIHRLYESKPHLYLSHLLGHEGSNSLLSFLKAEGLALDLSVSADSYSYRDYCLFALSIDATRKGMADYEAILEALFAYLAMLREKGVVEWVFREIQQIAEAKYRFQSRSNPMNYASKLASSLQKYPAQDLLPALYLVPHYRPDLIRKLLNLLNPLNMKVFLISNTYKAECQNREQWYGTENSTVSLSEELKKRLFRPNCSHSTLKLDLPLANCFVPTVFEVLPPGSESVPVLVHKSDLALIYHKQSDIFCKDTVMAFVQLICGDEEYYNSPKGYICGVMWRKLCMERSREISYLAHQAGLKLSISNTALGLAVSVTGFSQHFASFLLAIFSQIANMRVTSTDFQFLQNSLLDTRISLENRFLSQPYEQALAASADLQSANLHYSAEELLKAVREVGVEDVGRFAEVWLREVSSEWLVVGNINAQKATEMGLNCVNMLRTNRGTKAFNRVPKELPIHIPPNSPLILENLLSDPSNQNNCNLSIWQLGPETPSSLSALFIIDSLLKEPCFSTLRTKKQLGYIVFSGARNRRHMVSFNILVQSHVAAPMAISSHITEFIETMRPIIAEMTTEMFEKHQKSVYAAVKKADVSLEEEFGRYMSEMVVREYQFNRKESMSEAISSTTKEGVKSLFEDLFFRSPRRVDIQYVSSNMQSTQKDLGERQPHRRFTSMAVVKAALAATFPRL